MAAVTTQECYSDDWRRTDPDFAVFLPKEPSYHPEAADHFLVDYTPGGDLLAILTVCTRLDGADFSVVHILTGSQCSNGVERNRPQPGAPIELGGLGGSGWRNEPLSL